MRHIGSIPNEAHATRFGDHLLALGIRNHVEPEGNGAWAVWVEDDDHLERSRVELEAFLRNPTDPKYDGAERQAEAVRTAEKKKHERLRKRFVDVRTSWAMGRQFKAPVTIGLIVISLVVGAFTAVGYNMDPVGRYLLFAAPTEQQLEQAWDRDVSEIEITPDVDDEALMRQVRPRALRELGWQQIRRGQLWRLITPIFIHYGIFHLVFNMFWLRDLGSMIETRRSTWTLVAIVLAAAVASNIGQFLWNPWGFEFGGMSGVVYALFGYVWMKGRFEPHLGINIRQEAVVIMIVWLFACMTGFLGPIANAAHVIGLLVGLLFGYAATGWRNMKREFRR